jgi:hypothetical protein
MLRFPNPGSTISNFVSVYTAAFKALNGRVIDLDDIVQVVVEANLATSSGYVGSEAVSRSTRQDRSRDPLYNQMKMYAELFRTLGWLHPTASGALKFTFTLLGEQLIAAGPNHYWPLLRECVLGIAYPTRVLTISSDVNLRPFAFLLKAMKNSGGYLSRDEMIVGPLSADDDRAAGHLSGVVNKIAAVRKSQSTIDAAMNALSKSRKIQVNTLQNYTRWPIAIIRDSGWVKEARAKYADADSYRVFALTESGEKAATMAESAADLRLSDVEALTPTVRDAVAVVSHFRMLDRAGYDIETVRNRIDEALRVAGKAVPNISSTNRPVLFSPFQSLSLEDMLRAFPESPEAVATAKTSAAAAAGPGGRDDRSHLFVPPKFVTVTNRTEEKVHAVRDELRALLQKSKHPKLAASRFAERHANDTQDTFYPLITHLFQILGFRSEYSRAGVNYQRWDACVWIGEHAMPVEIKSPTEEEFLATKAVRQALENKVVLLSRGGLSTRRELSSLVVGFRLPNERGEMSNLIDNVYLAFGISLGVIDLSSLAYLAARSIQDNVTIDAGQLSHLRGFLDV